MTVRSSQKKQRTKLALHMHYSASCAKAATNHHRTRGRHLTVLRQQTNEDVQEEDGDAAVTAHLG